MTKTAVVKLAGPNLRVIVTEVACTDCSMPHILLVADFLPVHPLGSVNVYLLRVRREGNTSICRSFSRLGAPRGSRRTRSQQSASSCLDWTKRTRIWRQLSRVQQKAARDNIQEAYHLGTEVSWVKLVRASNIKVNESVRVHEDNK